MSSYIMRLDDACEKYDKEKWNKIEELLDKFEIKPLVGVIPHCEDSMMEKYDLNTQFWNKVRLWINKGWCVALHGYNHVYSTKSGGINPINNKSEFAGEPLDIQKKKIRSGIAIMRNEGINPKVFFAPAHTFDRNTIQALLEESDIKIISDTIANKPYSKYGITFVPQQSGKVRNLPFNTVTFCYHPNMMSEHDFSELEQFFVVNKKRFIEFPEKTVSRKYSIYDGILNRLYFTRK